MYWADQSANRSQSDGYRLKNENDEFTIFLPFYVYFMAS